MNDLTMVELTWIEKRIERWIRFGKMVEDQILDRRRRMVGFAPGSVFAFVRWASNDYGTIVSRIDILRAFVPGEAYSTVPFVKPGGEILLRLMPRGYAFARLPLRHPPHRSCAAIVTSTARQPPPATLKFTETR